MNQLNEHILEFLKLIKIDLSDREESFSQCKKVSIMLVQYLKRNSINAELIKVSSFLKGGFTQIHSKWCIIERNFWSHYIVKVGDIYVDLTWNQFIPGSSVPTYFTEENIIYYWENYYVV
jgi:hypothetical protein